MRRADAGVACFYLPFDSDEAVVAVEIQVNVRGDCAQLWQAARTIDGVHEGGGRRSPPPPLLCSGGHKRRGRWSAVAICRAVLIWHPPSLGPRSHRVGRRRPSRPSKTCGGRRLSVRRRLGRMAELLRNRRGWIPRRPRGAELALTGWELFGWTGIVALHWRQLNQSGQLGSFGFGVLFRIWGSGICGFFLLQIFQLSIWGRGVCVFSSDRPAAARAERVMGPA